MIMQHKFASLIELTSIWDSLETQSFLSVLKQVLEIDVIGLYKKAIVSGIFQQLYHEGESNDYFFYAHLLTLSKDELKLQSQSTSMTSTQNENQFEQLPDGLLCHIATYIEAKNVFTKWNHVNRKFFQIGLNPSSIKEFVFNIDDAQNLKKNLPKFKYDVTLSKLESLINYEIFCRNNMNGIVDQISMQHMREFRIGMFLFVMITLLTLEQECHMRDASQF